MYEQSLINRPRILITIGANNTKTARSISFDVEGGVTVSQYYRALQGYEDGKYAEKELREADRLCSDARGQSLLAEPEDVQRFDEFWQEANYLKEEGEAIRQNASGLIELWRSEGRTLGRRYNALREEFSKRLFSG
jgi:hypothetical protein